MKEKELERKEVMLDREIETLAERMSQLELETRSKLDSLKLEVKVIQLFIEQQHPETKKMFEDIRKKVLQTVNPEEIG